MGSHIVRPDAYFSAHMLSQVPILCAGNNDSEKVARLCRLSLAFVARLYACSTTCTCTIRLVNIIAYEPSHVTYPYVVSHLLSMNVQPSCGAMPDP